MKKIVITLAAIACCTAAASAQYMCTEQGTVLTYTETAVHDGQELTVDSKSTVIEVTTDANGVITSRFENIQGVPGNDLAEIKSYSSATYDPATGLTTDIVLTGDSWRDAILDLIVEAARSQGANVSDSDIEKLRGAIRTKGEITLPIPAEPVEGDVIPKSSIKMTVETQTMTMNLWEGKYLGYETVEVPAGTFENCVKVSYVRKSSSPEGNEKVWVTDWFAKGIGSVKTIEADKKGKQTGSTVLKSIKK